MTKTESPKNANVGRERRFLATPTAIPTIEQRADGKGEMIVGYAAVFFDPADPGTEMRVSFRDARGREVRFRERIRPGAFDAALRERDDAIGSFNHNLDLPLGRVSNGAVRLAVDSKGLRYEIDPPDTTDARDTVERIRRRDVAGSSFGFFATDPSRRGRVAWSEEVIGGEAWEVRWIEDLYLDDVGPVTQPAYAATSTGLRSVADDELEALVAERDAWRRSLGEQRSQENPRFGGPAADFARFVEISRSRIVV